MPKIYTKKGDAGQSTLYGGQPVPKSDLRLDAYGTIDELNSWIGLLRDEQPDDCAFHNTKTGLLSIQHHLFVIGSNLAVSNKNDLDKMPKLQQNDLSNLEKNIDEMETILSPMTHFILPGGDPYLSKCHIARTTCRRAERRAVQLHQTAPVSPIILAYINRLSDWLFVYGRFFAKTKKIEEIIWNPKKNNFV